MRIIDADRQQSVRSAQVYFTVREARDLVRQLELLLADPEANDHFHVYADDARREISCSIVTSQKLAQGAYTDFERTVLEEK